MNRRVVALCALFALSGFCGLIYESIWSHYLKHFVGHAAYAQSLVLMAFMGGMGLGAWLVSRWTHRIRNLLWGYAAVELIIGVTALAFHPAYGAIVEWAYTRLLPASCSAEGFCWSQWVLATALILPQSILLGTTFPLMTGGVIRMAPAQPGRSLALLYFLNSIGAVFGVLASGFVLIPWIGLPGALMTAGIGNVFLAVSVYYIGKSVDTTVPPPVAQGASTEPSVSASPGRPAFLHTLLVVSLLTGLSSFIYEIAWIRMLAMVLGSATHSFEIMLASFILGLALGGLWIRKRIERIPETLTFLAVVQIVMGVCALLTLPLYNHTFDIMAWLMSGLSRTEQGNVLFTLAQTVIALAVMLPATFCAGMTLPLISYYLFRHANGERAIGQVYAANTIGAIAGVLLTVHLLMPWLGLKNAMVVGAAIDIALGVALLQSRYRLTVPAGMAWKALAVGAVAFALVSPWVFQFDSRKMASSVFRLGQAVLDANAKVLFSNDGKTATVQVTQSASGVVALSTNGKSDGAIQMKPGAPTAADEATMALLGALPLAYRPRATEAAVIGFGTGMSSATLLGSPHLKRLDTIEIEPAMVEAAQHFRPVNELAFTDPRHHIVIEDAKAFFAKGQRKYDVIVSEPSNPWVSGVSSLFTEEFYARMRLYLRDDGVLVQWMHVYEITPVLVASVFRALTKTFPAYEAYMGSNGDMIIVASAGAELPRRSPEVFEMPRVKAMLERVGLGSTNRLDIQYMSNHRALQPLLASYGAATNSDYFPLVDLYGPQARFMRAHAQDITLIHTAEMPVLRAIDGWARVSFEGEAPKQEDLLSRQLPYVRAQQLAAFVRTGALPPADRDYIRDMDIAVIARNRLFTCKGQDLSAAPWDGVVRLATETIPFMTVADARQLWQAARNSPCAGALSESQARWLEMLALVAEGAWDRAGPLAAALLGQDDGKGPLQRNVLTQVSVTALLLAGQRDAAEKALADARKGASAGRLDDGWQRLLHSHARAAARR